MPSRKKAKGKARKAAKEAKAKEEESPAAGEAANQRREGSLEAQLQRLVISDVAPQKCEHGLVHLPAGEEKVCLEYINVYLAAVTSHENAAEGLFKAGCATKDKYAFVYDSKLDTVISMLLASGAQSILDKRNDIAQRYAVLAGCFEDLRAMRLRKAQALISSTKVIELESADDHTLVSFYRKRIPCSCLDEKYKEVKSVKKMGCCYNPSCSHPDGKVERSKMFCCTRCGMANYCSVECQKADWKEHKELCSTAVELKAAINSSSQT